MVTRLWTGDRLILGGISLDALSRDGRSAKRLHRTALQAEAMCNKPGMRTTRDCCEMAISGKWRRGFKFRQTIRLDRGNKVAVRYHGIESSLKDEVKYLSVFFWFDDVLPAPRAVELRQADGQILRVPPTERWERESVIATKFFVGDRCWSISQGKAPERVTIWPTMVGQFVLFGLHYPTDTKEISFTLDLTDMIRPSRRR